MSDNRVKRQSEKYEDMLLEAAFAELLLEECEALEAEPLTAEEEAMLKEAEQNQQKQLDKIARYMRRSRGQSRLGHRVKAALQYVAAAVLVVGIGFGSALAISPELRISMINFLTVVTDEYVRIGFEHRADQMVEVPDGWSANYYPAYIPNGYKLTDLTNYDFTSLVTYRSSEDFLIFSVSSLQSDSQLNSKDAVCENISIQGHNATLLILPQCYIVTWSEGASYFTVTSHSKDLAILVAESISLIQ